MDGESIAYGESLETLTVELRAQLDSVHAAREAALPECRSAIRYSGLAIRAVHLHEAERYDEQIAEARRALGSAQESLAPHPEIASAGFLHDAEKEVAEAHITAALVAGRPLPAPSEVGVRPPAWLNGLAEAASELRRAVLDRLRSGETELAQRLFSAMEQVVDMLVTVDYPDAITGGLRRTTDALRAVVERTRADLTMTLAQERLVQALDEAERRGG